MNKNIRTVENVIAPPPPHMVGDGFRVHNFFPNNIIDKKRMSPFFLLDYNSKIEFSPSETPRGVSVHPHRGFETVTISYHGRIAHHDSAGNSGVIREGDVQWMTAGSGILHKEYHEKEFSSKGGLFQMVQLWVNLPAINKMTLPKYQEITYQKIIKMPLAGNAGTVEVIAGNYQDQKGPASTFTPINIFNVRLLKNAEVTLDFHPEHNIGLLVIEGKVNVNSTNNAAADHFVLFKNDGSAIQLKALEDSVILVLSGEPINEPIAQYGPFLMNTHQELQQAISDVSAGKFGVLED